MCQSQENKKDIKAYYVSDDVYEIELPLPNFPELGNLAQDEIIAYILISNGEEITIINNTEEYETWVAAQS